MMAATHPFAHYPQQVRMLRLKDRHFARLFDELMVINEQISTIEHNPEDASRLIDLKMRRIYLTETLHEMLQKVAE